jgi:hypothetical protein
MFNMRSFILASAVVFLAGAAGNAQTSNAVPSEAAVTNGVASATTDAAPSATPSAVPSAAPFVPPGKLSQLGDPAPPLTVLGWAKGKPVRIAPGTNFYAVVFCSITRANDFALTNLSNLQKLYRDKGLVTVVVTDDDPRQLKEFVQLKDEEIDFLVADDDLGSRTARNYQQAFGQIKMPRAYVVDREGKVVWFGHPLRDGLGEVVDKIATGRFSLAESHYKIVATEQMEEYLGLAREGDTNAIPAGKILLGIRANDPAGLCDLASQIATDPFIQNRDVPLANAALDRALALGATNVVDITVDRAILLFQSGKPEEGLAKAKEALAGAHSEADIQEAQVCVNAMQRRLAAMQANPQGATNGVPAAPGQP